MDGYYQLETYSGILFKNLWKYILFLFTVFGLDSPLGLFPPGMEHKMYPLMDVDHRGPPLDSHLFANAKKKCKYSFLTLEFRKTMFKGSNNVHLHSALYQNRELIQSHGWRLFFVTVCYATNSDWFVSCWNCSIFKIVIKY